MPLDYVHPFSGVEGQTCSYSASAMAQAADALKTKGMSEKDFETAKTKGEWGKWLGKIATGDVKNGTVFFRGKSAVGEEARIVWSADSKMAAVRVKKGSKVTDYLTEPEKIENWLDLKTWSWKSPGAPAPAVPTNSVSFGKLTDEDIAAMFVKTKDELAKSKGILDLKGVNKALDSEVYASLSKFTGYTADDVLAKIERYKSNGNKLSALKKKVMSGKKTVPNVPVAGKASEKAVSAWEAQAEKVVTKPKAPVIDPTATAAKETVQKAVADMEAKIESQAVKVYSDEDVASAYLKAKDSIAADSTNPWTLYTKSDDFDNAIFSAMLKQYGIELDRGEMEKKIANYIATKGKLSVLKKKLIKNGELEKQAPTLKSGKAKGTADAAGKGAAESGKTGNPVAGQQATSTAPQPPFDWHTIPDEIQDYIYEKAKDISSGSYMTLLTAPQVAYGGATKIAKLVKGVVPGLREDDVLSIMKVIDHKGALKAGVQNKNLFEKKMVDWGQTASGKEYLLNLKTINQLDKMQPDLPADSQLFQRVTVERARLMQSRMGSWTESQKEALRTYTGSTYREINGLLRGTYHPSKFEKQDLESLIRKISAGMKPVTEDLLVHRTAHAGQFGFRTAEDAFKAVGKTVVDDGFLSTAVESEVNQYATFSFSIEVPKGTKAAFIRDISRFQNENELLIDKGTKFKVLKVEKTGQHGAVHIRLRAI